MPAFHYRTALITGASSGIGAEFARRLACQGTSLILVARRKAMLEGLAAELRRDRGVAVEVMRADLTDPDQVESLASQLERLDSLDLLVQSAGFGTTGRFQRVETVKHLDMIQVHVAAAVRLTRAALPGMVSRRRGAIVHVSSFAAYVPLAGNVTYCGTKAFLVAFSEALQLELRGSDVRVQALCPGFTRTGFHDTPEYARFDRTRLPAFMWQSAEEVVRESLRALERGDVVAMPGLANRVIVGLARNALLGRWVQRAVIPRLMFAPVGRGPA